MMEADTTRAREGTGMAEEFASNILEHLQAIRSRHDGIARELTGILSVEDHRVLGHGDIAALNLRMNDFSERLDRIEQHLDITDGS